MVEIFSYLVGSVMAPREIRVGHHHHPCSHVSTPGGPAAVWLAMRREDGRVTRVFLMHNWRTRWRSLVVLALMIGLTGAAVFAAIAGARRSATALDRFHDAGQTLDVFVVRRRHRPRAPRVRSSCSTVRWSRARTTSSSCSSTSTSSG